MRIKHSNPAASSQNWCILNSPLNFLGSFCPYPAIFNELSDLSSSLHLNNSNKFIPLPSSKIFPFSSRFVFHLEGEGSKGCKQMFFPFPISPVLDQKMANPAPLFTSIESPSSFWPSDRLLLAPIPAVGLQKYPSSAPSAVEPCPSFIIVLLFVCLFFPFPFRIHLCWTRDCRPPHFLFIPFSLMDSGRTKGKIFEAAKGGNVRFCLIRILLIIGPMFPIFIPVDEMIGPMLF